jgi:hypothetical protein
MPTTELVSLHVCVLLIVSDERLGLAGQQGVSSYWIPCLCGSLSPTLLEKRFGITIGLAYLLQLSVITVIKCSCENFVYISIIKNIFISFWHVKKNSELDCVCIVWWNCLKRIRFADARFCVHDSDAGTQHAVSHGCKPYNIITHDLSIIKLALTSNALSAFPQKFLT